MKVKLITKHTHDHGHTRIFPELGETKISESGHIEVDKDLAEKVVALDIGFSYADATTTTTTEEVITTTTVTGETTSTTTLSEDEKKQILTMIDGMKMNELTETASVYPKSEWQSLNKAPLQEYLKKKITD